jgi:hypothetical protein
MSLHALKEPITLVSRCGKASSPNRVLKSSPRRRLCSTTKVLAALDALGVGDKGDSSIEIIEPIRPKEKAMIDVAKAKSFGCNPSVFYYSKRILIAEVFTLFLANSGPYISAIASKGDVIRVEDSTIKPHKSKSNKSKELEAQLDHLPAYSYKAYKPAPTTVYTRHEEETNDLVQSLRG